MAALMTDPNFLTGLIVTLVFVLVVVGLIYALRRKYSAERPKACCPGCQTEGEIRGQLWGNFRCRQCQRDFVADHNGRVFDSIRGLYLKFLGFNLLIWGMTLALILYSSNHPMIATSAISLGILHSVLLPLYRKPFPMDQ